MLDQREVGLKMSEIACWTMLLKSDERSVVQASAIILVDMPLTLHGVRSRVRRYD